MLSSASSFGSTRTNLLEHLLHLVLQSALGLDIQNRMTRRLQISPQTKPFASQVVLVGSRDVHLHWVVVRGAPLSSLSYDFPSGECLQRPSPSIDLVRAHHFC